MHIHYLLSHTVSALLLLFCVMTNSASAQSQSVEFRVQGSGDSIVLIPGLMSDQRVWDETAQFLSKRFQVHLANVAGFGASKPVNGTNIDKIKGEITTYIERNNLGRVILVGHSFGGFLALSIAVEYPQHVDKVISVDGLPFLAPIFTRNSATKADDMLQQANMLRQSYSSMNQHQLRQITATGLHIQATSNIDQQRVLQMAEQSDPKTVGTIMAEMLTTDLRMSLKKSSIPILILGASGGFSSASEHSFAQQLYAQQIQGVVNAKLKMNRSARHFIMFDDAKWLHQQMIDFL